MQIEQAEETLASNDDSWDSIIGKLVNSTELSDIKFVIRNANTTKEYYCHTFVLSLMGSHYVRHLIQNNVNGIITLNNISHLAFEYILECMYKSINFGGIALNNANLAQIWFACETLQLTKIAQRCIQYALSVTDDCNSFVEMLFNLQKALPVDKIHKLLNHANIIKNINEQFWNHEQLSHINIAILELFLKNNELNLNEDKKWYYCKKLSQSIAFDLNDKNDRTEIKWQQVMKQFIHCIKFSFINHTLFVEEIRNSGVLTVDQIFQIYDSKLKMCDMK